MKVKRAVSSDDGPGLHSLTRSSRNTYEITVAALWLVCALLGIYLMNGLASFAARKNGNSIKWVATCYDWIGCLAFCVGGGYATRDRGYGKLIAVICSIVTAFGGGAILRDMITLGRAPAILGAPEQIAFVVLSAVVFQHAYDKFEFKKYSSNTFRNALTIADSIGVLAFVKIGIGCAADLGVESHVVIFLCGFFPAVGGGFIAAIIRASDSAFSSNKGSRVRIFFKCLKKAVMDSRAYYVYAATIVILYKYLSSNTNNSEAILVALTPVTLIGGFLTVEKARSRAWLSLRQFIINICTFQSAGDLTVPRFETAVAIIKLKPLFSKGSSSSRKLLITRNDFDKSRNKYHRRQGRIA